MVVLLFKGTLDGRGESNILKGRRGHAEAAIEGCAGIARE